MNSTVKRYAYRLSQISEIMGGRLEVVEYSGDGLPYVLAADYDALEDEVQRLREAVSALADIAHEHRHELIQQRFPDNDEGDAFARHRDSRVGRINRILAAALTARTGQEVKP